MARKTPYEQGLEDAREISILDWLFGQRKHDETVRRQKDADLAEQANVDRTHADMLADTGRV